MSGDILKICGVELDAHDVELLEAALKRTPAEHKGIKYGCISALTIRTRVSHRTAIYRKGEKVPYIIQVELMSAKTQSVTIADPKEVTVLKDWRPANE